jgi:hypothetical protein
VVTCASALRQRPPAPHFSATTVAATACRCAPIDMQCVFTHSSRQRTPEACTATCPSSLDVSHIRSLHIQS